MRACVQVYIVGPESQIDMMPSSKWLTERTSRWSGFRTHLMINIKRDEALEIISAPGMLLVLCSMVDNMPYVVAEAAVRTLFSGRQSACRRKACLMLYIHSRTNARGCCESCILPELQGGVVHIVSSLAMQGIVARRIADCRKTLSRLHGHHSAAVWCCR